MNRPFPGNRPVEPEAGRWAFADPEPTAPDLVGLGADLEPGTVLAAYRRGLFPMPLHRSRRKGGPVMAWWSPDPRGILPVDGLQVSRSLRRSCARYEVRTDTAFDAVTAACADPTRDGAWIDDDVRTAYHRLHQLGWAHSVETWSPEGELVGGLYGINIGGLFAGESMFHHATDASKVALVALVERLRSGGVTLLDVQWSTPHLESLGVVDVSRTRYLTLLAAALTRPDPDIWG